MDFARVYKSLHLQLVTCLERSFKAARISLVEENNQLTQFLKYGITLNTLFGLIHCFPKCSYGTAGGMQDDFSDTK